MTPSIKRNKRRMKRLARQIPIQGHFEETTWTQKDAMEFDLMMCKKYNRFMGIKDEDCLKNDIFTREEQIERYGKSIYFLIEEESKISQNEPNWIEKRIIISQRRKQIEDRGKEMFDDEMIKEIFDKVKEYIIKN